MADFNVGTQSEVGSQMRPQQPVVSPSAVGPAVDLVGKVGGTLAGAFFANEQQQREVKRQTAINTNLEAFSQAQLKLANAVDTGAMSSAEARMRQRANYSKAIANNPGLIDQFSDIQKSLTTTAGLAKNVAEGTEQEQMNLANEKAASAAGWIPSTASQAERQAATAAYLKFQRGKEDLAAAAAQLTYERAQIGIQADRIGLQSARVGLQSQAVNLQSAKLGLMQAQRAEQAHQALGVMADSYSTKFANDLADVQSRVQSGQLTQQEGIEQLNNLHATLQSTVNRFGGDAGAAQVNLLVAPLTERYNNAKEFVAGNIDKQVLENQNTISDAKQKLMIKADPQARQVIAASQLFQGSNVSLMPAVNNIVVGLIGKNMNPQTKPVDPHPDTPEDKSAFNTYTNVLKSNMAAVSSGAVGVSAQSPQEVDTHVQQILKGVNAYSLATDKPEDYNQVVDFLSSPEFGKYTSSRGGVPADVAAQAKQVLQEQYENAVLPLIKQEYERATVNDYMSVENTGQGSETMATSSITPTFTGAGVTFIPAIGSSAGVKAKAKDLNNKVAPVLNRLIRMSAHLQGGTNYKSVYDQNYSSIFGVDKPKESGDGN